MQAGSTPKATRSAREFREGVDLDAVALFLDCAVLLCPGDLSVESVAQAGKHQKENADKRVALSVHTDQDPQCCRDQ